MRLLLVFLLLSAGPAAAAESALVHSARMTATLITDTDAVAPGQVFHVALRLRMAPGWHTYWSNPGDAGAPPELDLTLPPGAASGAIAWPPPHRLSEQTIVTYAYTGEVVLPLTVTPGLASEGNFTVRAAAHWLVCERICVPEEGSFDLELPGGVPAPSAEAPLIERALGAAPIVSPYAASITPSGVLTLRGTPDAVVDAAFFPTADGVVSEAMPQRIDVAPGRVSIAMAPGASFSSRGVSGVVVLRDAAGQERAVAIDATPGPDEAQGGLLVAIALALGGGLLLNLMPCVFPVLAMKAAGLVRAPGAGLRASALAFAAGVLATFCGLGGALMAARAAGLDVGWGSQFQSPLFVAAVSWLLLGVGLNLSGVFQVGVRLAGAGQGLAARPGLMGDFLAGLLAVLVATPCTAPFMGGAIAAALAMPAAMGLVVFAALGAGLAAPYLLLAAVPGVARMLPRPGAWMEVLRGALALPMYAAAAWLVWVASEQSGSTGVFVGLAGGVAVAAAAWAYGWSQRANGRARRIGQAFAVASVAAACALLVGVGAPGAAQQAERFTPGRLAELRAEGRPVFVNMTAAWCVTCLVNERFALAPSAVQHAFADRNVAYLKGDWTRQDPEITAYLRGQDRDGVPLYVFYRPGAAPDVLPQILTQGALLDEIGKLGNPS